MKRQGGFSLIELMIAMSLSLLLMLGVYKVFDLYQSGFRMISSLNDREDNAQLSMKILSDSIRMADHWGGLGADQVRHISGSLSAAPGACDAAWVFNVAQGIFGVEGKSSVSHLAGLPKKCLKNKNYLANSDLLALRFADSDIFFYEIEIDNNSYQKHYFVRSQSGKSAVLFQGNQLAKAEQLLPDEGFHYNLRFHSSLFFLRPCLKTSSACVEGNSVLARLVLMGDRYVQEALVEGIEQMHFEYGVDENNDALVDKYLTANKVHIWQQVLSVKIFLLVRNRIKDRSIDENGKIYVMNSSGSVSGNIYKVSEKARYYSRRLYQSEVALRNRLVN